MCTVHYIVHLQCTFSLSCTYKSKGFCRFSMGMGTKEDESSTGSIWAAGFHCFTGACYENYEPFISLISPFFFQAAINHGY
jgi:hypothetical protein